MLFISFDHSPVELDRSKSIKYWDIGSYTITYSRKIGPCGPPFYQYQVFENEKYLSYAVSSIENDSCILKFRKRNDYYVLFNLCDETYEIAEPNKVLLNLSLIDSIIVRPYSATRLVPTKTYVAPFYDTVVNENFDSTVVKKLSRKQEKEVVRLWNKASTNGHDRLGRNYHYLLLVYENNSVRRIRTLNCYFIENGQWSYKSNNLTYFDELWNN